MSHWPRGASLSAPPLCRGSAALIVSNFCYRDGADRARKDAAAGLEALATGGTLDLDAAGRARAAKLAALVRAQAVA